MYLILFCRSKVPGNFKHAPLINMADETSPEVNETTPTSTDMSVLTNLLGIDELLERVCSGSQKPSLLPFPPFT